MGKILTYLNISEDNQSRDVLDAERLLEGMQAIYAVSPSGSKKDNFAIPLAEMTKIFIEKVKGIAPKEEPKQELNFKVGDVFKQAVGDEYEKDYGISTFTILSIDEEKQLVKIGRKDLKTLKTLEFERAISKVFDDVDTNWWIPYEQDDTFKVGDMFYVTKEGKEKLYQVLYIDGQNFTFVRGNEGNIESYEGLYSTDEANSKLKEGRWTKISDGKETPKEQDDTFKVGDKFVGKSDRKIYQIKTIDESEGIVFFEIFNSEGKGISENDAKISVIQDYIKKGLWIKVIDQEKDEFPYQVDDRFYLPSLKANFKISKISGDNVSIRYEDGEMLTLSKSSFMENITIKTYIPLDQTQFKIGDKYLNKTVKDTFTITQVYTDFIDVKFSGGNEATYDILFGKEKVADGSWVKVVDEEKEEQPKSYKVGDKFLWAKEDMTFTIDFIKNGEVGIIYSAGLTGIMSTEQFEKGLSTGYYKPYTEEAKPEEKKTRKPRQPRTKSEQDKKIEHILDINLDELEF